MVTKVAAKIGENQGKCHFELKSGGLTSKLTESTSKYQKDI